MEIWPKVQLSQIGMYSNIAQNHSPRALAPLLGSEKVNQRCN